MFYAVKEVSKRPILEGAFRATYYAAHDRDSASYRATLAVREGFNARIVPVTKEFWQSIPRNGLRALQPNANA